MREGRPVAYYSKKLNPTQQNYSTMDKTMLSIVMIMWEFYTILLNADLYIHTDHKNLTFKCLENTTNTTMKVIPWRVQPLIVLYTGKTEYSRQHVLASTEAIQQRNGTAYWKRVLFRGNYVILCLTTQSYYITSSIYQIWMIQRKIF